MLHNFFSTILDNRENCLEFCYARLSFLLSDSLYFSNPMNHYVRQLKTEFCLDFTSSELVLSRITIPAVCPFLKRYLHC